MRSKLVSLLVVFMLLCSSTTLSFAQGSAPAKGKDLSRVQTIERLNKASNGNISFSDENGQVFLAGKLTGRQAPGERSALQFLQDNRALFGISDSATELKKTSTVRETNGDTFIKFAQMIEGIEMDGSELIVHYNKSGELVSVSGQFNQDRKILKLGKAQISQSDAVGIAEKQFTFNSLSPAPKAAKCIITANKKNYETYRVSISYTDPKIADYDVFVEAYSGKVIRIDNKIEYDGNTTGTGTDVTGKSRTLNLYKVGSTYYMMDYSRPETRGIITFSLGNSTLYPYNGIIVSNSTNTFKTEAFKASVSAHYFAGQVLDFYKKLFGRNSLDNNSMVIDSYTHLSIGYNNAFWDPDLQVMVYGDGDGTLFTYLSGDLDVVGHEMTHGVISNTANLDYHNQSGALNESVADTFGVLIETYSKYNVASGDTWKFNPADWVVGDEILTPAIPGDALRNLADPSKGYTPQPANMSDYKSLPDDAQDDYGGVHTNSGITNKAAFLVARSIGMAKTAQIYYRAIADYMFKYTDFAYARLCLIQSAKDLYGDNSSEAAAVGAAFSAVGIGKPAVTDPYEPNNNYRSAYEIYPGTYHAYCTSDADDDWYKFSVHSTGDIQITLTDIPAPDDYDIYLYSPDGGEPVAISENSDQAPEDISYSAFETGVYYLLVSPYTGGSTANMYTLSLSLPREAVADVTLNKQTAKLKPGDVLKLGATVKPADAANQYIQWASSSPSVATVDKSGTVKAVSAGTATITATTGDGGFTAKCDVSVAYWVTGLTLGRHTAGLMPGDKLTIAAAITPANATNKIITWSSSDSSIASVDAATGVVTGVAKGSATITATTQDGAYKDSCAMTVVTALAAPGNAQTKSESISSVRVSWNETYGANYYEIYRATASTGPYVKIGTTADLWFANSNLICGTAYYYKVRACRSASPASNGPYSAVASTRPLPPTPAAKAAPASYNSIKLSWSAVIGATRYELSRSTSPSGVYKVLTTTTALSYTNTAVNTGTTYYYRVRAYHLVKLTKVYGQYSTPVSATAKLATPGSVKAIRVSSGKIKVSWGKVAGATRYEVWRSTGSGYKLVATVSGTYCINSGLIAGQTYYYEVKAYRLVSGKKVYSGTSAVVSAKA